MWTVSPQHLNKILKTENVYFDLWLEKKLSKVGRLKIYQSNLS